MSEHPGNGVLATANRVSAAIFIVALFVRLMPFGFYVTPDEPMWVLRSVWFHDAVAEGRWTEIPQTGHPGLTTMALGATGIWLTEQLYPSAAAEHLDWLRQLTWLAPENSAAFGHLAFFLPAGRGLVALTTSLALVAVYRLGRWRMGERAARLTAVFLALDPFLGGHSSVLHTDALQGTFLLLAAMLLLPMHQERQRSDRSLSLGSWLAVVGAAAFLALAGLTKTLGLLAAPGLAIAVLLWGQGSLRARIVRVSVLTAMTLLLIIVFYPPLWRAPLTALETLIAAVGYHEGTGLRSVFFAGEMRQDAGPWFYPAVLLFRGTPPVLLGLGLGAVVWMRRRRAIVWDAPLPSIHAGWFLLPVIGYLGALTIATKKFDRYALSVLILITPLAAWVWRHVRWRWRLLLIGSLLLPWALVAVAPFQYATPLLGGNWIAQHIIPLGWGEASGFAAHRLNRWFSDPAGATIATQNVPGAAAIFKGTVWSWDEAQLLCTDAFISGDASNAETYVPALPIWVAGRQLTAIHAPVELPQFGEPVLASGSLPGLPPTESMVPRATTADLQAWLLDRYGVGMPFLWIHAPGCHPLTEAQLHHALRSAETSDYLTCEPTDPVMGFETERCVFQAVPPTVPDYLTSFGGVLNLLATAWDEDVQAPDAFIVQLRWEVLNPLGDLDVYLALRTDTQMESATWADGGQVLLDSRQWPASKWLPGQIVDTEAAISLPLHLPPGSYRLILGVQGDGGWLGHTRPDGVFGGIEYELGTVNIAAPPYATPELILPEVADITMSGLRVVGIDPPPQNVWPGAALHFSLGVERQTGDPVHDLMWELWCDGERRDGGRMAWGPSLPEVWPVGHRYILRFAPRLSPALAAGACTLCVISDDGVRLPVGAVTVRERTHVFEVPSDPDIVVRVGVADFAELVGADLGAFNLAPGETLTTTLYWQAQASADQDYTVFVHLIGPDGQVWGQSDSWPAKSEAPTASWIPDEIIVDQHDLTLREGAITGTYEVVVGLYDAQRGTRVALYRNGARLEKDQVNLATIEVP